MSRTNALALACLMTLCACSTTSSQSRKPDFVTAQCPAAEVRIDRSDAAPFPACVHTLTTVGVPSGRGNADVQVDLAKQVRDRDICLDEVAKWRAAETEARKTGAPGA